MEKKKSRAEPTSNLISQAEAAQLRGVSRAAIRDLIRRGRLNSVAIGGREMVYRDEVLNFEQGKPGPVPVNEVTEFCNEHPDLGPSFRDFAIQYRTLAEVWGNCSDPYMMLSMLNRQKYRNAKKLYEFIQSVYDSVKRGMSEAQAQQWISYFLKQQTAELDEQVASIKITRDDARFRDFISASGKAGYVIRLAVGAAVQDAIWNAAIENVSNLNDDYFEQVRRNAQQSLADKLRDVLGNPFAPGHYEDFYHGRRNF